MSDEHKRGSKKGEFCAIPGTPCDCGNDYIKVCKPGWAGETFKRLIRRKTGTINFEKKFEAHHILCVASVSDGIVSKEAIEGVVKETKWCINNSGNMLAMPLWGHYVKWYCDITAGGGSAVAGAASAPFQNIPAHDWDHNCSGGYTTEVNEAMKDLADYVEQAGHEVKPDDLKGALEAKSSDFRGDLQARGGRLGGTHAGWAMGSADPQSNWFQPFSMASDAMVTKKGFPARHFDEQLAKWINRIADAIKGG